VITLAVYEAARLGSMTIETEHFLLGLIRDAGNLAKLFLRNHSSIETIWEEIERGTTIREKISSSIDLPLSNECKRILAYAAEESERLNQRHIGTEHLLLGILREEKCRAAEILHARGFRLNAMREELARSPMPTEPPVTLEEDLRTLSSLQPNSDLVPEADTATRIAEALWIPQYGAATVARQTPLRAELTKVQRLDCDWFVIDRIAIVRLHSSDGRPNPVRRRADQAVGGARVQASVSFGASL
jgi:Clp amino terminal domain, pathogenicity island component